MENDDHQRLELLRLGIDTQNEFVVFLRSDCPVLISEGFEALTRVRIQLKDQAITAVVYVIDNPAILGEGQAGLSESAWHKLSAEPGDLVRFSHLDPVESLRHLRAKMYGHRLGEEALRTIIQDITDGKFSNIHLAAFVATTAGDRLDIKEIADLTRAMIDTGNRLVWEQPIVADKHCIGGLPGNRTTPIVVSIAAAAGLTIPKTSSRAITSPAGTADTMEVITNVDLSIDRIYEVVARENACFAWGGAVRLSPSDNLLIGVERALDIDSEGQMIASVLSKKAAAGATHVVIDLPMGPTAKVRSQEEAEKLKYYFKVVASHIGLQVKVLITDGRQPVGRGIGPALEAADVLKVLRRDPGAPADLRARSLDLAGALLELTGLTPLGEGVLAASRILDSGAAYQKFEAVCRIQGAVRVPPVAAFQHRITAPRRGKVVGIDNRRLAKLAKLAGAPYDKEAGLYLAIKLGAKVQRGDTLFTIHAANEGELQYALRYFEKQEEIIGIR